MALYLKYRPQTFADVVGQDHIVTTMERAVDQGRISHAYLLCGSRGTGKTSVARILAKTILLAGIEDATLKAQALKGIEEGSFVDLIEIDAASNRRIDDVRDLIEKINFAPAVAKAKVYIIDEVHMLTKEAFNALLKTLEEPPEYAYFVLATTELYKVPDTIQSRCQRFLFKRVKDDDIVRRLQYIADQEHIKVDREALRAIARHALGSFRDGIALLDQLRSLESISLKDIAERIGKTSTHFVDELSEAVANKNHARITALITEVEDANVPLDLLVADLLTAARTSMHAAIERGESLEPYVRMNEILLGALRDLRQSPVPGLVLESALLSLTGPMTSASAAPSEPIVHVRKPEAREEPAPSTLSAAHSASPAKDTIVTPDDFTLKSVRRHWEEVVKETTPPSVRMSLKNGVLTKVDGDTLHLSFPSTFHRDRVAETKASRVIEDILHKIFRTPVRLTCLLERDSKPLGTEPTTDLVEAAAEVFGSM